MEEMCLAARQGTRHQQFYTHSSADKKIQRRSVPRNSCQATDLSDFGWNELVHPL